MTDVISYLLSQANHGMKHSIALFKIHLTYCEVKLANCPYYLLSYRESILGLQQISKFRHTRKTTIISENRTLHCRGFFKQRPPEAFCYPLKIIKLAKSCCGGERNTLHAEKGTSGKRVTSSSNGDWWTFTLCDFIFSIPTQLL